MFSLKIAPGITLDSAFAWWRFTGVEIGCIDVWSYSPMSKYHSPPIFNFPMCYSSSWGLGNPGLGHPATPPQWEAAFPSMCVPSQSFLLYNLVEKSLFWAITRCRSFSVSIAANLGRYTVTTCVPDISFLTSVDSSTPSKPDSLSIMAISYSAVSFVAPSSRMWPGQKCIPVNTSSALHPSYVCMMPKSSPPLS